MHRVQRREVAVVVVRRAVDLERLRHVGDPLRRAETVPGEVDHAHVHGPGFKVAPVIARAEQVLAGADSHAGGIADFPQPIGFVHVDLHPHHAQVFERLADPGRSFDAEVEVQVERNIDVRPDSVPECSDQRADVVDRGVVYGAVGGALAAAKTAEVDSRRIAGIDDIRLQCGKPAGHHLPTQRADVVPRPKRRHADDVGIARARRSAVRPVDALASPDGPSEQFVHGHAERLGLDIPQCEFDTRDGFCGDSARTLAGHAIEVPVARFDGTRILVDEHLFEFPGGRCDAVGHAPVGALAVTGDIGVGAHGDKRPRPPPRVDDECIDSGDFHGSSTRGLPANATIEDDLSARGDRQARRTIGGRAPGRRRSLRGRQRLDGCLRTWRCGGCATSLSVPRSSCIQGDSQSFFVAERNGHSAERCGKGGVPAKKNSRPSFMRGVGSLYRSARR